MASISAHYDARAEKYDDDTTFHRTLASEYISYAKPQPGESLLDLACGTGLVTYAFLPHLLPPTPTTKIIGVDLSPGMLSIARSKSTSLDSPTLKFLEHDISNLHPLSSSGVTKASFNLITICSALILLPSPAAALKHWSAYLAPGGRLVVDVPSPTSMLSLKLLSAIAPEFGIPVLGDRTWITSPASLHKLLEDAGLDAEVHVTRVFDDIPARTEAGRDAWGREDAERLWGVVGGKGAWGRLEGEERARARERWVEEFGKLVDEEGVVREEGRLYVGVGRKV